jgi:hypothetical protein
MQRSQATEGALPVAQVSRDREPMAKRNYGRMTADAGLSLFRPMQLNLTIPLPIMASIERISPSLEEAAQNLGASGEHVARDAKRRPVKLASSGLRSARAGANGCASIDGYEVA